MNSMNVLSYEILRQLRSGMTSTMATMAIRHFAKNGAKIGDSVLVKISEHGELQPVCLEHFVEAIVEYDPRPDNIPLIFPEGIIHLATLIKDRVPPGFIAVFADLPIDEWGEYPQIVRCYDDEHGLSILVQSKGIPDQLTKRSSAKVSVIFGVIKSA